MNAQEERHALVRERLASEGALTAALEERLRVPWRVHGVVAQAVFFILTAVAILALAGLCHIIGVPKPGLAAGLVCVAVAEYLIGVKRWFRTGVEIALWVGGLLGIATAWPSPDKAEAVLILAAVFAAAGARLRHPLAGAIAAGLAAVYAEERFDAGLLVALVLAAIAVAMLLRKWRRPSTEWLFAASAILLPMIGRFLADEQWHKTTVLLYLLFGTAALVTGVARRHHAVLISGAVGLSIAAFDLAARWRVVLEVKLGIAGAALLGVAWVISRLLRDRTTGIVITPARFTTFDDEVEMAATVIQQPETARSAHDTPLGGGGEYGGGGATGDY